MQVMSECHSKVAVVVIGRNEGKRLVRCLESVSHCTFRVYVDSASVDDSVAQANMLGTSVVSLNAPPNLTAARGRNAGMEYLTARHPEVRFVQMLDGDCEVIVDWFDAGIRELERDPGLGLVFGRRRERFPERSIYNRLCDEEWNVAVGEALTCGGDVLCRVEALRQIGGYNETMIAGEDPDMAMRMRAAGWRLARIDAEMTLHDAAITRFGQWWRRSERAGHAFAELAHRHQGAQVPDWRRQCRSIFVWGAMLPLATLAMALITPFAPSWSSLIVAAMIALWPLKMLQVALALRHRLPSRFAFARGTFLMIGKLPEFLGLFRFQLALLSGRRSALIEYKDPATR